MFSIYVMRHFATKELEKHPFRYFPDKIITTTSSCFFGQNFRASSRRFTAESVFIFLLSQVKCFFSLIFSQSKDAIAAEAHRATEAYLASPSIKFL